VRFRVSQEHRYKADVESWSFFISISNVRKHSDWLLAPVLAAYASTILIFSLMVRQNHNSHDRSSPTPSLSGAH